MLRCVVGPLTSGDYDGGWRRHRDECRIALLLRGLLRGWRFLDVRLDKQPDVCRKRNIQFARPRFEVRPFGRQQVYADVLIALDRKTFSRHRAIVGGVWLPVTNEHRLGYFIT